MSSSRLSFALLEVVFKIERYFSEFELEIHYARVHTHTHIKDKVWG